jgi:hypothetical protein
MRTLNRIVLATATAIGGLMRLIGLDEPEAGMQLFDERI